MITWIADNKDSKFLNRRGGAPSGAAAFITIGGMGVSTPIFNGKEMTLILVRIKEISLPFPLLNHPDIFNPGDRVLPMLILLGRLHHIPDGEQCDRHPC